MAGMVGRLMKGDRRTEAERMETLVWWMDQAAHRWRDGGANYWK
jgi:hypothetical protein